MGVTDVPQWLPSAFVRSVLAVGATADREAIEETFRRLLTRWQEPDRRFHNLKHLVDVLARVDELAEETHHPDLVRLAAWYHGAVFNATPTKVYARSGGEDERASAELAKTELSALGVPGKITARIADLILNLRRHDADPKDIDSLALCDADLAILATEPQRYRAYRQAVREEYAHLPMRHYVEGRAAIVRKLLDRRHLFLSPLGAQWEDTARENLRAELERLHGELARMGEPLPGDSVVEAEAAMGLLPQNPGADDGGPRLARPDHVGVVHFAPSPVTVDDAAPGTPLSRESPVVPGEAPGERGRARPPAPRSSSLESLPDELGPLGARPRTDDRLADDRRLVAQRSRDRIDLAVRLAKERVERARGERDRLEAARAEREEATAAFRERRHVRTSSTPSPELPADGAGDGQRGAVPGMPDGDEPDSRSRPAARPAGSSGAVPAGSVPAGSIPAGSIPAGSIPAGSIPAGSPGEAADPDETVTPERLFQVPQHGMEREPELFERPRRKGDKKREKRPR